MPAIRPKRVELAEREIERVEQMRDAVMRHAQEAVEEMAPSIQRDAARAIDRIVKSKYNRRVVRRELKRLTDGHFRQIRSELASQLDDISRMVTRYQTDRRAWLLAHRKDADPSDDFVSRYRSYFEAAYGAPAVRAALVSQIAKVRRRSVPSPRTAGEKVMAREMRPWRKEHSLSLRLHHANREAQRQIHSHVARMIREGRAFQDANELLLGAMKATGKSLGGREVPAYLRELERAGNALLKLQEPSKRDAAMHAEYEQARKRWRAERRKLRRYADRLASGGKVQNALIEVLQRTEKEAVGNLPRALEVYVGQKHQYIAERILETETQTAFRAMEAEEGAQTPGLVGYVWHLQRGARRDFAKRTKPRRIKLRSGKRTRRKRRCVCEIMDGKKISVEYLQEYPQGGHPHCMCWFEPVYDRKLMRKAPITAAEDRWFEREFG